MGDKEKLAEMLNEMDVPELRKNDFRWLMRNLAIRNSKSPNFNEAMKLIIKIIGESKC